MIGDKELLIALNKLETIVVVTDNNGNINYVNDAFEEKYGYTREEAMGKNPRILKSGEQDTYFYKDLWETIKNGDTWEGNFLNKTKSGKLIWENAKISPILIDGKIDGYIAVKEDITYKKELEEQFHKEKFLLDELFDNAPVGVMLLKPIYNNNIFENLIVIKANPIAAGVFNKLGIVGLTMDTFLPEYQNIYAKINEFLTTKQIFELPCPSIEKHLKIRSFPLGDDRFCMYLHDITNYKNSIIALQESEQRYYSLIEDSPALIRRFSKDGIINYINSYYAEYYDQTPNKILGKNIFKLLNTENKEKFIENLNKLTIENPIVEYQQKIKLTNGEIRWQKWIDRALFDTNGNITEYQSVGMDFTKLKNAEIQLENQKNQLNTIFDNSLIGIGVADKEGNFELINSKLKDLLKIDKNLKDLNYFQIIPENNFKEAEINFKKLFTGETKTLNIQRKISRMDGTQFWGDIYASSISLKEGKVKQILGLIMDITERHRMEEELKASENKLKKLNNTKDKLFSIIAHDIRNPFNAILGFSNILDRNINDFSNAEIKDFVSKIVEASEQTYKLLEDLLTWAKSQLGQLQPNFTKVKPEEIINDCIKSLASLAKNKNIKIQTSIISNNSVLADSEMFKFVIRNLLHNGIKFSHPNSVIDCKIEDVNNNFVCISVKDYGIGIRQEKVEVLFNLEQFLTTSGTDQEKGTGLGLSLSKEMIELNSGTMEVISEVNKGSEFRLTLPVA